STRWGRRRRLRGSATCTGGTGRTAHRPRVAERPEFVALRAVPGCLLRLGGDPVVVLARPIPAGRRPDGAVRRVAPAFSTLGSHLRAGGAVEDRRSRLPRLDALDPHLRDPDDLRAVHVG